MSAERVLITGGRGLLGSATVRALQSAGYDVRTFQRTPSGVAGVEEVLGDLRDRDAVDRACAGCAAVLHLAAKVGVAGAEADFTSINVEGTRSMLAAAQAAGVHRFVYVSSPSVAHTGRSLAGAPAGAADPHGARGAYSRTKAEGELLALAADRPGFAVTAIRPHLVWGPGDTQLIERIWQRARAGRLVLVGSGAALIDTTYVDNAADALVAALRRAAADDVHGRAFVVSNGEPRTVAELFARICAAAELPAPSRRVPFRVAWLGGALVERLWGDRPDDPPMTSFLAEQLATAHWFDQRATREALHWAPRVSLDEGFERLRMR